MATAWDSASNISVDRDGIVRSALIKHLLVLAENSERKNGNPDRAQIKKLFSKSLATIGVPNMVLEQFSGNVEEDIAKIQQLDIMPVVTFATLKAARRFNEQKNFESSKQLMLSFIKLFPEHAEAHYLLGKAHVGLWEFDIAEEMYEKAIALDTTRLESYSGLATLYERTHRYELADKTWRRGFEFGAIYKRAYLGKEKKPIRILVISSVLAGNIRFMRFLNTRDFQITSIFAESYTPSLVIPPHDVVFQGIGDTELCVRGVQIAEEIAKRIDAPLINHPMHIKHTSREENSNRFRELENVVTPLTMTLDRADLLNENAEQFLLDQGYTYPMLMRSPGYFNGHFFEKVETKEDIARVAASLPGEKTIVIQYIDTMLSDGTIRKYRMMGIDKKLYPVHLAVSYNWKIHYFSSNMRDEQSFRDEEYAYLYDTENVLGPKVMKALSDIVETLGLDYCGIDFTVNDAGEVVVFEANATMALLLPDKSPEWEYRREPIQNALDAAKNLIYARVPNHKPKEVKAFAVPELPIMPKAKVSKSKSKAEVTREKKRKMRKASKVHRRH